MKWIMSLGKTARQTQQLPTVSLFHDDSGQGVTYLGSLVYHCHIEGEVSELEGGHPRESGAHHAGMLEHLLHRLLLPLLLLLGQAAQLTPQGPSLSIVLPSGHRAVYTGFWGPGPIVAPPHVRLFYSRPEHLKEVL